MLVLVRNRGNPSTAAAAAPADAGGLSTGTFVLILVIGAIFTVALIYALHGSGNPSYPSSGNSAANKCADATDGGIGFWNAGKHLIHVWSTCLDFERDSH